MHAKLKRFKRPLNERIGDFFFTLGFFIFIIGILPSLAKFVSIFYYLFVGILILGTLGIILEDKEVKESISSGNQFFNYATNLIKYAPYILGLAALFSLIATIIYAKSDTLDEKELKVTGGVLFTILPIIMAIIIDW